MDCLLCKLPIPRFDGGPYTNRGMCNGCGSIDEHFKTLVIRNPEAAYNWAIQKALDLAGDITGVKPGDSFLEVENGELGIRSVNKVKTTIARDVPPELRSDDKKQK